MVPDQPVRPTASELEILCALWRRGPSTVRQVHEALSAHKATTHNTTLKLMQIMHAKGILKRDESRRPQVYSPADTEEEMQRHLVSDFVERAFAGSARKLMVALTNTDIGEEELAEIRRLLDEAKEKG
jgi:predicted transcriptional regulator